MTASVASDVAAMASLAITALSEWLRRVTARSHARMSPARVEAYLTGFIEIGEGDSYDDWFLFLEYPIDDPLLESVRRGCKVIDDDIWARPGPVYQPDDKDRARVADILEGLQRTLAQRQ